jgi:hypothetical protein
MGTFGAQRNVAKHALKILNIEKHQDHRKKPG